MVMIIEQLENMSANTLLNLEKLVLVMLCTFITYFLSLIGTVFSWFSSFIPSSIQS